MVSDLNCILFILQGCTRTERQVAIATKFYSVPPNICGSELWNLLYVTLLTPGILNGFHKYLTCCVISCCTASENKLDNIPQIQMLYCETLQALTVLCLVKSGQRCVEIIIKNIVRGYYEESANFTSMFWSSLHLLG